MGKKKFKKGKVHIVRAKPIPKGTVYKIFTQTFTQTLDIVRFLLVGYLNC